MKNLPPPQGGIYGFLFSLRGDLNRHWGFQLVGWTLKQKLRGHWVIAPLIASGMLLPFSSNSTAAQSAECRSLARQLAQLEIANTANPEFARWDQAVRQQNAALDQTRRQIARASCQPGGSQSRVCTQLFEKQSQMASNLKKLERQRSRHAGDGEQSAGRKRGIERRMASLSCGEEQQREVRDAPAPGAEQNRSEIGLFSRLFGGGSRASYNGTETLANGPPQSRYNPDVSRRIASLDRPQTGFYGGGQYRTLCVRTCDGFYFPISFSTRPSAFGVDDSMCQNMCPGADARLFVHRNPGQDIKDMTGLDGVPYTALPTAFKYRTEFVKNCSCQVSGSGKIKALNQSGDPIQDLRLSPADDRFLYYDLGQTPMVPIAKVPADEDPDTIDNILGNFVPYSLKRTSIVAVDETDTDGSGEETDEETKRKVRIVGPDYFVAQ